MGIHEKIINFVIYITIMSLLLQFIYCQKYQKLRGLTLLSGSSLRSDTDVRSIIECLILCKKIEDCYAVSWDETSKYQNCFLSDLK